MRGRADRSVTSRVSVTARVSVAIAAALLVAVVASGCTATVTGRPPSPTPTATPTHTVAAAPTPAPLPANGLFQINAVATASNGAIADLVEVAFVPGPAAAGQTALLDAQCNYPGDAAAQGQPSWESQYPRTVYLNTTITATARTGTPAWPNATDPVAFSFLPVSAYTGDYTELQATCAAGTITVPGTVAGVAPLWGSNPAHGPYGWATPLGSYGFNGGGNDPGGPLSGTTVISACAVQLSATAIAAGIGGWATRPYNRQTGCVYVG
jgi:hypothetical protein